MQSCDDLTEGVSQTGLWCLFPGHTKQQQQCHVLYCGRIISKACVYWVFINEMLLILSPKLCSCDSACKHACFHQADADLDDEVGCKIGGP